MNGCSRVCLVLLRLAIGWHLCVEGVDKLESLYNGTTTTGPTTTHRQFNSSGYLRESSGPLAWAFRWQAGDLDQQALERFDAIPFQNGDDPKNYHDHMPPELAKDWENYLGRYLNFYEPEKEDARAELENRARTKMTGAEQKVVSWLLDLPDDRNVRETTRTYSKATYTVKESFHERVQVYRDKYRELRRLQDEEFRLFDRDTKHQELTALKGEVSRLREELLAELNAPLRDSLEESDVLTLEEKARASWESLMAERRKREDSRQGSIGSYLPPTAGDTVYEIADRVAKKDPVPPAPPSTILVCTNWIVALGLTFAGFGLLLGLLTRSSCFVGAALMLMFYLASPALPWVPESLKSEGHYLFINKNIIEMFALLALMCLPTGRWVGLDGLLYVMNPWRWRASKKETA